MADKDKLPQHIAIIMDGNGRWAKRRGLPRVMGHRAGMKSVKEIVKACRELGIKYLTLYAFSTENWKRPKREIETLMRFLNEYIEKELKGLKENDIRINVIGRIEGLPDYVRPKLKTAIKETRNCKTMILNVALNYSGRAEIVDAARKFALSVKSGEHRINELDERLFAKFLYTEDQPDPDLLIRTSGEMRISNFLLWQISYSELYITPKLWPDFRKRDLEEAILEYQTRNRRFGA